MAPPMDGQMLSPTLRRLVRSYGVLVLIALAFLFLALFVREQDRTVPADESIGLRLAPVVMSA